MAEATSAVRTLQVRRGVTTSGDELQAVDELAAQIGEGDPGLVTFFCSSRYDLGRLGSELSRRFRCPTIGCTTAGEIDGGRFLDGSLVGFSIASGALRAHARRIPAVCRFQAQDAEAMAKSMLAECEPGRRAFGLLLIDGLTLAEERTAAFLSHAFRDVPIIGGSAGDDMAFEQTHVFCDGEFARDSAAFCLIETSLPFATFRTQHFEPTDEKLVITEAEPERRRVLEINGEAAASAYAGMLGLAVEDLTPDVFSDHPVMLKIGGEYYVRSIQRVGADGALDFYCAIDTGLVLTMARGVNLVENLRAQLGKLRAQLGPLQLVIGCDCILRRLEIQQKGLVAEVADVLAKHSFVGFCTYGEQFNAIHVNQTLTGVAIGG